MLVPLKIAVPDLVGDSVLKGILDALSAIVSCDPVIRQAMTTGEVSDFSLPESGTMLNPDEVRRIGHGLVDRLTEEVRVRWRQVWRNSVAKAGTNGIVPMPEEPQSYCLLATAAIVHGSRVLTLTPTLPAEFETHMNTANQVAAGATSWLAKVWHGS